MGAGYVVSRALLPRLSYWSPFCLLELLQHSAGTGMEDVALAGCIWKWGRIPVTSYVDPAVEAITTEAALNRTQVARWGASNASNILESECPGGNCTPCCTFVAHSLEPDGVRAA